MVEMEQGKKKHINTLVNLGPQMHLISYMK